MKGRAAAVVDLAAITANLDVLRRQAGAADVMGVVKADAYGHGMAPVARALRRADVRWLGVALPTEALALRAQGDTGRVLAWLWTPGDPAISSCVREGVDLAVSSPWALAEVVDAAQRVGRAADIHVKVDGNLVSIEAEAKSESETRGNNGKVLRSERQYGSISRSFSLGQEIDAGKVQAKYADGVLSLDLPKKTPVSAPAIVIQ